MEEEKLIVFSTTEIPEDLKEEELEGEVDE